MSIRWKLLILFLVVSLTPIFILRFAGMRSFQGLGQDLASHGESLLMESSLSRLHRLVQDRSLILSKNLLLVETFLRHRVEKIQSLPPTPENEAKEPYWAEPGMHGPGPSGAAPNERYPATHRKMSGDQLTVSFEEPTFLASPGHSSQDRASDAAMLAGLTPDLKNLAALMPKLILWQITILTPGPIMVFPGHGMFPKRWNMRDQPWVDQALSSSGPVWSDLDIDPLTGQTVLHAAMAIPGPDNVPLGVTIISLSVQELLFINQLLQADLEHSAYLVRVEPGADGEPAVLVRATNLDTPKMGHAWSIPEEELWLVSEDKEEYDTFLADLQKGESGVRRMEHEGRTCFWSYASTGLHDSALVLVVPVGGVIARASEARSYVRQRISQQQRITGITLVLVLGAVILVTFVLARHMAAALQSIAGAFRKVAGGDFQARAPVLSKDELGELAATFNELVPALEDQVRMKESLTLAREVQATLLPECAPDIPGLDVAGLSLYCDETGGDLYDYLPFAGQGGTPCLGVVVGDVSGHGVASALLMSSVRSLIRCRFQTMGHGQESGCGAGSLAGVVTDVNRLATQDTYGSGRFMTLFLLTVDPERKSLGWVRAGHEPALLFAPETGSFTELKGEGLPLGVLRDQDFEENSLQGLPRGGILLLGTDGISETLNPETGEMFGKERVRGIIRKHAQDTAQDTARALMASLAEHRAGAPQEDDATLVIIRLVST